MSSAAQGPGVGGQSDPLDLLHDGVTVHGALDERGIARYQIAAADGQGFTITVTQPDVDLRLRLLDAKDQQIARANLRRPQQGPERLLAVATSREPVTLSIERASETSTTPARFAVTMALDPDGDRARLWSDAARAYTDGESQTAKSTGEAFRAALPLFEHARATWLGVEARLEAAAALNQIGLAQMQLSRLQDARAAHEQALSLRRAIGDRYGEGVSLNNLASIHNRLGDSAKAGVLYEEAVAVRREVHDRTGLAYSLMGLAFTRSRVDDGWPQVIAMHEEALALVEGVGDRRGQAEALYYLGYGHKQLNDFYTAMTFFERALTIRRELNDLAGQASILTQVAAIHLQLGDAERALEILGEAQPLRQRAGDRRGEAYTLQTIGVALTRLGHWTRAGDELTSALQVFEAIGDREGQTSALMHLASARAAAGAHAEALALATRARGVATTSPMIITTLLWCVVGDAHLALGDLERAADAYASGVSQAQRLGEALPAARALTGLGRTARARGDLQTARRHLLDALGRIESVRAGVPQSELRASFLGVTQQSYLSAIDTLTTLHEAEPSGGYAAEALAVSERRRARTLVEMLAEAQADLRPSADQALLKKEEDVRRRLNARAAERAGVAPAVSDASAAEIDHDINGLVAELRTVQADLRTHSPRYAAVVHPAPLDLGRIQALLDPQTILLEYSLGETRSYLWAITSSSMTLHTLPSRATITAAVRRATELIASSARRGVRGPLQRALADISTMVLGDAAPHLGTKRLAIVADGALQFLPFAALPSPRRVTDETPLVVDHEIVMLPSASALYELRQDARRVEATKSVAILADPVFHANDDRVTPATTAGNTAPSKNEGGSPSASMSTRAVDPARIASLTRLPYTRAEALAIASKTQGQALTALSFDATRELALSPTLRDYRILHFATHAVLDTRHPELSGIVLSLVDKTGLPRDGFLRLHDIFNLRLDAEVVVLSACDAALGEDIRGEGLVGLTRGFMHAGASQIIASLWNVNDRATASLMAELYRGLLRGQAPAAALRAAQIALWENPRLRMPVYWAGFTVQGDWRSSR